MNRVGTMKRQAVLREFVARRIAAAEHYEAKAARHREAAKNTQFEINRLTREIEEMEKGDGIG